MTRDSSQPLAPQPPEDLLREVSRDLAPVKPPPLPLRLALRVVPLALLASLAVLALIGLRRDAAVLGPLITWGVSIAQVGLAVLLVWIAARESTPSRRLPANLVWFSITASCLIVVAVTLWTFVESPPPVPSGHPAWIAGIVCGGGATVAGVLLVTALTWFFRHSLAAHPALAGSLYGAGAGIAVNAGWRLACPISTPWHSLGAHGAGIAVTALLGAMAARLIANRATRQ